MTGSIPASGFSELLVNDEGNAALHYVNADLPDRNWTHRGPGRDLQLIGNHRVLRSHPQGYVELDLRGAVSLEVTIPGVPGAVESARRLPSGHTVVAGNGAGGSFIWEIDREQRPVAGRQLFFSGVEKVRLVRQTEAGTFLFCSEKQGTNTIHEADWKSGAQVLFEVPKVIPADSMVKAVRVSADIVTVSTGYAASLLRIDTANKQTLLTIGGKVQPDGDESTRPLSPFFFSGYQTFENGDCLVANWQGHSAAKNGQGYQLLRYDAKGVLLWAFDQTLYPGMSSINNVIALDGLNTQRLHDEPRGVLVPIE